MIGSFSVRKYSIRTVGFTNFPNQKRKLTREKDSTAFPKRSVGRIEPFADVVGRLGTGS